MKKARFIIKFSLFRKHRLPLLIATVAAIAGVADFVAFFELDCTLNASARNSFGKGFESHERRCDVAQEHCES